MTVEVTGSQLNLKSTLQARKQSNMNLLGSSIGQSFGGGQQSFGKQKTVSLLSKSPSVNLSGNLSLPQQ